MEWCLRVNTIKEHTEMTSQGKDMATCIEKNRTVQWENNNKTWFHKKRRRGNGFTKVWKWHGQSTGIGHIL
jgi:hypothetical protein